MRGSKLKLSEIMNWLIHQNKLIPYQSERGKKKNEGKNPKKAQAQKGDTFIE